MVLYEEKEGKEKRGPFSGGEELIFFLNLFIEEEKREITSAHRVQVHFSGERGGEEQLFSQVHGEKPLRQKWC